MDRCCGYSQTAGIRPARVMADQAMPPSGDDKTARYVGTERCSDADQESVVATTIERQVYTAAMRADIRSLS